MLIEICLLSSSYEYFMKRQQAHDIHPKKLMDIVKRLDEGLYRSAANKVPNSLLSFLCHSVAEVYTSFSIE